MSMNGFWQHFSVSLRLHLRSRMALVYGYLFPLIFLAAFGVLYRHDEIPLLWHMGELLTVSVLGGACLGFPTALVSERALAAGATCVGVPATEVCGPGLGCDMGVTDACQPRQTQGVTLFGFPGDADIGGNHMLWHPLNDIGELLQEFIVFLFRGFAERSN